MISEGDYSIFLKGPAAQLAAATATVVMLAILFLKWRQGRKRV